VASPFRLLWASLLTALAIAVVGAGWEIGRFGLNEAASARRLEAELRRYVAERSSEVEALAARVALEHQLIIDATTSRDRLPDLFNRLSTIAEPAGSGQATVTVYVPAQTGYRVLAWSDGPAGDVASNRLSGPRTLFAAPGTAGLRLVFLQPIELEGRRIAVAAAETVLSAVSPSGTHVVPTRFGAVTVIPSYAAGALTITNGFAIEQPRLEVHFARDELALSRYTFRRRALALAACPPIVALLLLTAPILDRRRRTRALDRWLAWSLLAVLSIALAGLGLSVLARLVGTPDAIAAAPLVAALVASVAIVPGGLWWRRGHRLRPEAAPLLFASEHLAVGGLLAATIAASGMLLSQQVEVTSLENWKSALFPFDPVGLVDVWGVLLGGLAVWWTAAIFMAIAAGRWRLTRWRRASAIALVLWLTPTVGAHFLYTAPFSLPAGASIVVAAVLTAFALAAFSIRRYYRRTTQSMRLLFGFLALVVPLASIYPMTAIAIERTSRARIERILGPQTAGQWNHNREVLLRTQQEIDQLSALKEQLRTSVAEPVESQTAFIVWSQTSLKSTRVVSDLRLYGPDRSLISRFALNFPEYLSATVAKAWEGKGCGWDVSGEVTRLGAADRPMLHAERGLCDANGKLLGAVAVRVAPSDYGALPFVASQNPYEDVLRGGDGPVRESAPPDVELTVYGWSLRPLFTTNPGVAWVIGPDTFNRLYRDGTPFWAALDAGGRSYHVYFLQNRAGIYAFGYPTATFFDHAARLAEIAAIAALLFVLIQITTALALPLARRAEAPLAVLLHEIRTSFYRKLFLFFVLVAVGPVVLFAVAFSAYMTSKFRADVEREAASVVTVAERVFEQVASADQPVGQAPTDDVMVWIRQVIAQDVNLFEGSELVATSQRDLFNSGFLPTRTPAIVYRRIALDRLPTFVTEDPQYLVASSPVPARGHDAVLSVPLAPRQREIADETNELKRGVLVGSVLVVLFAAWLGASLASRVSDPVARLTKATRQIAAGRLDVQIAADTADELRRLVDDFNTMTATLVAQRAELARTNQLKAWNEMARQVAHEIKNPLTPIQLAAEHLDRVHSDRGRPLGEVFDQCIRTVLGQVRLLRQIASEFANFAGEPRSRPEWIDLAAIVDGVVDPYRLGLAGRVHFHIDVSSALPRVRADRTLLTRAVTNLVENAIQAMPLGGTLSIRAHAADTQLVLEIADTGVGMDADAKARAFEPYFSTKTGGSGLGLANTKRNIEREGGTIALTSTLGQGTTVRITLPFSPARPDATSTGPAPSR